MSREGDLEGTWETRQVLPKPTRPGDQVLAVEAGAVGPLGMALGDGLTEWLVWAGTKRYTGDP